MPRGQTPTTTSYAMLGLLAVRPWSTYELTNQIRRSLARFWPRASSKLYEEPRKLVALGYATAESQNQGRRRRTVYTITEDGRRALAAWLTEPGSPPPPALESEQLLRVFLADNGTKGDLLRTIEATRRWARETAAVDAAIARSYLEGDAPFPDRAGLNTLVGRYLSDMSAATERWADWAGEVVASWPDDLSDLPVETEALRDVVARDPRDR
ncbi:Transcriptional regulator, PadR family [Pseudonocardia sp. Ae356_Ps1]|uniref:PadR family transcriptional regulator n=1 Tax=unclassified Pseudonocardia TaxID=2619320 RepID=UPI00094AA42C|nr:MULTISPECIES: PadR family transcriptional regulator [unclassified Pseudonocardia]OLL71777.1 Transcriptional regulator, PadR family [Pseudonocardia sp. Ae150A_Ps1]OLL91842.1 Transcriptional regulator, PadR family [Pseudonocardia sp. Ae356_Ps1]